LKYHFGNFIQEFRGFFSSYPPIEHTKPGLLTYQIQYPGNGFKRIHLRITPKGEGVLFNDVTDVVHLNSTAAIMARMALDEIPLKFAESNWLSRYPEVNAIQIKTELSQVYELVEHFKHHEVGCATCDLSNSIETSPIFSLDVTAPYKVDLALTYRCNNRCHHCYNEPERLDMSSLSLDEWKVVIGKLERLGIPHLIITGGEATLHPEVFDIISYADTRGMIVGLNTNGRRLAHTTFVDRLVEAGLNHVQITLGSNIPEIHNNMMGAKSFHQTVDGIENSVASPLHTITNTTLTRSNMSHAEDIIEFLFELGIRTFAMNGMIHSGSGYDHPDAILEEELAPLLIRVRDCASKLNMRFLWYTPTEYCRLSPLELDIGSKRCNAGEYSICIEPNGDVLPCQSFYTPVGNILRDDWTKIWNNEICVNLRDRDKNPHSTGLPKMCWECPDLSICAGGCLLERQARSGLTLADSLICAGCSRKTNRK
jgi:radical SAM protein with 4Fe4S-binding SPASM domain